MSVAFDQVLFGPLYATWGVAAVLTPQGGSASNVTAIDKTRGVQITDLNIGVMTVRPVASLRASELAAAGIEPSDLDGGNITLNGGTWIIDTHLEKPTPAGIGDGEVWLILQAAGP